MPDYSVLNQQLSSYSNAAAVLPKLQQIYAQCQEVSGSLELYLSGTDVYFNTAAELIFTPAELAELGDMLTEIDALVTAWSAQHAVLLDDGSG